VARFDNGYSRLVAIVKVALPLVALLILSSLFLLSRSDQPGEPLPYSDAEVGELAREQRLGSPVYSGITDNGSALHLTAEKLTPDATQTGLYHGTDLAARVDMPDGLEYHLTGPTGTLDDTNGRATLTGGLKITTSDGYTVTSPSGWIDTDLTDMELAGPVHADGPLGTLDANGLTVTDQKGGGAMVAVFHGGVKLIYTPQGASSQ